jgi:hypothetical protein
VDNAADHVPGRELLPEHAVRAAFGKNLVEMHIFLVITVGAHTQSLNCFSMNGFLKLGTGAGQISV